MPACGCGGIRHAPEEVVGVDAMRIAVQSAVTLKGYVLDKHPVDALAGLMVEVDPVLTIAEVKPDPRGAVVEAPQQVAVTGTRLVAWHHNHDPMTALSQGDGETAGDIPQAARFAVRRGFCCHKDDVLLLAGNHACVNRSHWWPCGNEQRILVYVLNRFAEGLQEVLICSAMTDCNRGLRMHTTQGKRHTNSASLGFFKLASSISAIRSTRVLGTRRWSPSVSTIRLGVGPTASAESDGKTAGNELEGSLYIPSRSAI